MMQNLFFFTSILMVNKLVLPAYGGYSAWVYDVRNGQVAMWSQGLFDFTVAMTPLTDITTFNMDGPAQISTVVLPSIPIN